MGAPLAGVPLARRFSVCEHVLRLGDLAADLAAARDAGASAISLNASDFGEHPIDDLAAIVAESGLTVSSYIDPSLMRLGPDPVDLDRIDAAFALAASFGAPSFLFIAGELAGRSVVDADAALVDNLHAIAARTSASGVRPMLEPLHPVARELSYVHTVAHALDLVRPIATAGIVVDTGASWWERDLVGPCRAELDRVLAVQITDVSAVELAQRRYVRGSCASASAVPVADIVRSFVAAGYEGWFEHEVLVGWPRDQRLAELRRDHEWFAALWD